MTTYLNRTLMAGGGHSPENGFAGIGTFVALCICLMAGSGRVAAAEADARPVVALSLNGSAAVTARKGWPFIFEVALMHPQAFASPTNTILIASTGNVWSASVRIEIRDAQGQLQSWPLHLRQTPASSLELDGHFIGRLQWLLSPAETVLLTGAKYELRAILDTTETSVTDAWKGIARSVPASLDLGEPVAESDAIEFENQQTLFARYAALIGDRDLALSNIDALLNRYPTNIGGLTYKAFLLANRGDRVAALAVCDQALQQVELQNPTAQEPPEVLLKLQHDLIDQLQEAAVAPPNDDFANRIALSGDLATTTGANTGGSSEPGESNHAGLLSYQSVWWTWTAPTNGSVAISTEGSSFATVLAVYTGTSVASLTPVASDAYSDTNLTSLVNFPVTKGTTYQVAVDSFLGQFGQIKLSLVLQGPGLPVLRLGDLIQKPNGEFQFALTGPPNATFVVEASPDLLHWTQVKTDTMPRSGMITCTDTQLRSGANKFFRAKL